MGFIKDTFFGGAEKKAAQNQVDAAREAQQISRQYYDDARKSIMDLMGPSYSNIMNAYQGASQLIGQGKLNASDILRQSFQNSNQIIQSGNDAAINAILGGPSQMQLPQQAQGFGLPPQRMMQSQPTNLAGMPSGLRALAPQNQQFNNTPQIAVENPNMVGGIASNIQGLNQPTMQPQAPTIQQPPTAGIGLGGAEQAIGQGVQNQLGALRQGYGGAEQALNQYGAQAIGAANQGLGQGLGMLNNTMGMVGSSINQGINALQQGENRALGRIDQFTGQAVNTLNPYAQTGQQALNQEAALSGALGGEAQQQAINQFMESPAQKFLREQGEKAVLRQASATGGLRGGSTLAALQERGIGLAAQNQQQQLENLRSLAGRGQDAATNQAGFQQQAGTAGAGITANLAGQQAGLYGQQAGLQGQLGSMGAQMANQGGQFAGNTLNQLGQQIGGLRAGAGENMANVFGNQAGALSGLRSQAGRDVANQMNQQAGALSGNQLNLGNLLANLDTGTAAQLAELLTGGATTGANANANMAQLLANLATGQGSQLANLQTQIGNAQAAGRVGQSGAVRDTAGTIAQLAAMFSDQRLKDNITKLVDGVVNIYAWTWKHISEIPENMRGVMAVGVIAQEVQQQYPECVHDVGGYLAVDYSKLANEVSQ